MPVKPVKPEKRMSVQQYTYLTNNNYKRLTELQNEFTIIVDHDMGVREEADRERHDARSIHKNTGHAHLNQSGGKRRPTKKRKSIKKRRPTKKRRPIKKRRPTKKRR